MARRIPGPVPQASLRGLTTKANELSDVASPRSRAGSRLRSRPAAGKRISPASPRPATKARGGRGAQPRKKWPCHLLYTASVNAVRTPRLALLALLVPLACAQAPPLAGTWKGTQTFTRGTQTTTVETTYVLSASGATFSGLVFTRGDRREVVNGTVDGTHLAYGLRNP